MLVSGVVLAALVVVAPVLNDGTGPRPDRVLVALLAGVLGEVAHLRRERLATKSRPVVAAAVILVVLVALWWGWWR